MGKKMSALLCLAMLAGLAVGCGDKSGAAENKTVVSILYMSSFPELEELVESTYSDIDLQCEIMPYSTEQLRRLRKGNGPDLVITSQPSSAEMRQYLADISDTGASSAYDGTIMKQMMLEGKSYLLPLPGEYSGYIVNETLLEQANLPLPTNNQELVSTLEKLKELGLGVGEDDTNFAIQSAYFSDLGMFYLGYMVPDFLGKMEGVKWLADYRNKVSTIAESWGNMFDLTDSLIEKGLLDKEALGGQRNSIRSRQRMGEGTLAAVFGNSTLFSQCQEENKTAVTEGKAPNYSYRMLPFLSDEGNEPWLIFSPSAYIGVNADASEEKQEAGKRVLELLSTQEGQDAVMEDMKMGVSCLKNYESDGAYIPAGVDEYVESGYIYNVNFPDKIIEYMGSSAQKMMADKMTKEEVLQAVDQYYYEGSETVDYNLSVVGVMEKDLLLQNFNVRREETELGNFLADCVAEVTGAPIAVVNGGSIRSSLYAGEIYGDDLEALFPFDNQIVIMEMDGQTLWDMLDNSVSTCSDEFPGGRFLQVSGLRYTFDSSKPAGDRLCEVTLPDGTAIDKKEKYQIALNNYMTGTVGYSEGNGDGYTMLNWYDSTLPKGSVLLVEETNLTYRDALELYFDKHEDKAAGVELDGRIADLALEQ